MRSPGTVSHSQPAPRPGPAGTRFRRPALGLGAAVFLIAPMSPVAHAKDLEPRSYSNTPVGLNFLIAGYVYAEGKLAFDPSTSITDAKFHSNSEIFAYARSLDAWGKSAKFDVVVPYSSFYGHGLVADQPREREVSGFNDPRFRFSMNFYGAPALSLKEFVGYRQDLIVGASLQVTAPLGQYDSSKLINLGNNRWSFKPELGISKAWGRWTAEVMPSVTFYTDNTDFNNGRTFAQAPLYAVQGHVIHSFPSGIWLALNGTWFKGERTTVDGVQGDNMQTNTRAGLTLALPVDRYNSVKLYASTGTSTRTGSDFSAVGAAWQHRWGGGY
jgi:hypothetical protein